MTLPGIGMFIKSEWTAPNGAVFEMQHRYEDRALIEDVIRAHAPDLAIELGTAKGGFACLLASIVPRVVTVDHCVDDGDVSLWDRLTAAYPNLCPVVMDCLAFDARGSWSVLTRTGALTLSDLEGSSRTLLYTDNGNKVEEITRFAPLLKPGDLLGTHDYLTEVPIEWVEPFLADLGFVPHRHDDFAALAHPEFYPASLTRFWVRT